MTTSSHTYSFEERGIAASILGSVKSSLPKSDVELRLYSPENTPRDVVEDLKIGDTEVNTFLESWVKKFNPESSKEEFESLRLYLVNHYGAYVLTKALAEGVENGETRLIASAVLEAQVEHWKLAQISEQDLFTFLELDIKASNPFKSSLFSVWLFYMNFLKKSNKDIFGTFKAKFEKFELVKMLDATIHFSGVSEENKELAKYLQKEQFKEWLESGIKPTRIRKSFPRKRDYTNKLIERIKKAYGEFFEAQTRETVHHL